MDQSVSKEQNKPTAINQSLSNLQSQRALLVKRRDAFQMLCNILFYMAMILPLVAIWMITVLNGESANPFAINSLRNSPFSASLIVYSVMFWLLLSSSRTRLRQIEVDIQEIDFRIDLQELEVNKHEIRAEKILRLNDFQLQRYYNLNISQNSWVFGLGVFCIILGMIVIGVALHIIINVAKTIQVQIITGVLGAIGAILTNYIAAIYLKMNTTAAENLTGFHTRLVETHQILLGSLLASRIDDDAKRWETLSQLSQKLMQKGKDQPTGT